MFYLSLEEFLNMAETYKEAPCPNCKSPILNYVGYTFIEGDMSGQLHMDCSACCIEYDLNVHSLKNNDVLH